MTQLSIYMQAVGPTARRLTVATTALALVLGTWSYMPVRAQQGQPQQQPVQGAPQLEPAQLDQLVAPIALYPDNLLGQILSASTYPLEIVMAARWASANARVTGSALEDAMQSQPWDPSVKALTAVPQVLAMMSEKLDWSQQLGEAYLSQPDDIAAAVQRLRARADASDNLKSSEQIRVKRVRAEQPVAAMGPEYIVIEPTYPERIYVPVYDPYVAYGVWGYPAYRPFYWSPPGYVAVGVIGFGAAVLVGTALWATYNWNSRRVFVNPVMYSSFNRVPAAQAALLASGPLRHDPVHRGTLGYKNPALNTQFSKTVTGNPTTLSKTTNTGTGQNLLTNSGSNPSGNPKPKGGKPVTNVTNTTGNNTSATTNPNKVIRSTSTGTTTSATTGTTGGTTTGSQSGGASGTKTSTTSGNNTGRNITTNNAGNNTRTLGTSVGGSAAGGNRGTSAVTSGGGGAGTKKKH